MFGSEKLAKDCLEYVVFEKHLADEYGAWRIHGKIIPDWMPPGQPVLRTMRKPDFGPLPEEEAEQKPDEAKKSDSEKVETGENVAVAWKPDRRLETFFNE